MSPGNNVELWLLNWMLTPILSIGFCLFIVGLQGLDLCYLECWALQTLDDDFEVAQQERPGVDEVDPVHGHYNDTVPALKATCQTVFNKERVWEHKAMLLIPKEDGSFSTRTHLGKAAGFISSQNQNGMGERNHFFVLYICILYESKYEQICKNPFTTIKHFLIKLHSTYTQQKPHLTAQAAYTSLPHHAEQLRLTWVLMTKETNPCLTVHAHKARVWSRKGTAALCVKEIKRHQTPTQKRSNNIRLYSKVA